jgi:hypothetical protein
MFCTTPARILIGIAMFYMVGNVALGQPAATTRIEGKVTDSVSHRPVGVQMNIVGPSGKKTSIKSSAVDGTYLAVINESGPHKFQIAGFNVYRKEFTINVPLSTNFQEIKHDINVRALVEGDPVAAVRGFELNSAALTAAGMAELGKIKDILSSNQQMNVLITVLPDEDQLAVARFNTRQQYLADSAKWDKDMKAWEKKYKKKKEKPEPPVAPLPPADPADPNTQLVAERKATILAAMKDVKNEDLRITVVSGTLPAAAKWVEGAPVAEASSKKSKKPTKAAAKPTAPTPPKTSHNTMVVTVGKVKRLFD